MLNHEYKNLLRTCLNPKNAYRYLRFLLKKCYLMIKRRFAPPVMFYPAPIKKAWKNCRKGTYSFVAPPILLSPKISLDASKSIELLGEAFHFDETFLWDPSFNDPEKIFALHRWMWLLFKCSEEKNLALREWGLKLIQHWCTVHQIDPLDPAWHSYNVSERIANAILFLTLTQDHLSVPPIIPPWLRDQLYLHAEYLASHLEYLDPEATGNHVLNNARALFFAGQLLNQPQFTALALAIVEQDLPRLVDREGCSREGSSHYHFLLTRWLLEMVFIAKLTQETSLLLKLESILPNMLKHCWLFIVYDEVNRQYQLPLIGDVSPDCPWEWLIDLLWSSQALVYYRPDPLPPKPRRFGWGDLFSETQAFRVSQPVGPSQHQFRAYQDTGWYRLDRGAFTLIWHVEPEGVPSSVSHAHADLGGFTLYYRGQEVLIDAGRLNYLRDDPIGMYGVSARAHNTVLVDNFAPFNYQSRSKLPAFYHKRPVRVTFDDQGERFRFCLQHHGFSRIYGDRIVYERVFDISHKKIKIIDQFHGAEPHHVAAFFHWANTLNVNPHQSAIVVENQAGTFRATCQYKDDKNTQPKMTLDLLQGATTPSLGGWHSPNYNQQQPVTTTVFQTRTPLPRTFEFVIAVES